MSFWTTVLLGCMMLPVDLGRELSHGTRMHGLTLSRYDTLLYHASNLGRTSHTITLRNLIQGRRLSYDRVIWMSGL